MKNMINVLVVDDSALVRKTLQDILESDSGIRVMETASDPYVAVSKMRSARPDVIVLDVEMPKMDGITFLRKIMSQHPIPVVICSTLAEEGSQSYFKALEAGAVDIIQKPRVGTKQFLEESRIRICDAVKSAAQVDLRKIRLVSSLKVEPKLTADAVLEAARPTRSAALHTTEKIVAVGASTGGTEALRVFLERFPVDCPAMAIVQHMPEMFTKTFAERLNGLCRITVREAQDGDTMLRGQALIAPGSKHMLLKRSGARYFVEVREGPLVRRHRPSVDVLFRSVARYAGPNAVGVIMTGMGDDGAMGMLEMKNAGAFTLAQDEASSVVFGMPHEAIAKGGVHKVATLTALPTEVLRAAATGAIGAVEESHPAGRRG
ncbi:protein-glutamate methylesterase/protein-glutamine glutaminase [Desulfocurvus sp. DL9XJH121]